jgi:transcriptional regulator with XRE-family HTH domain
MLNLTNASILNTSRERLPGMSSADFGKRVRELRKAGGFTQQQLADLIGVTRSAISQIESGLTKGVKPDHLLGLAHHLNVGVDILVNGKATGRPEPALGHTVQEPTSQYLASLTEGEVELLQHVRESGRDHNGREQLARQALALLRALTGTPTEQRRPKH